MSQTKLTQMLEQEGLKVVSEEVSPKGIIKFYLKNNFALNEWAIFTKLGLSVKELPGNYTRMMSQDKVLGYRIG